MKKSVNALTQDIYDIPEVLDDSKNIKETLDYILKRDK